MTFNAQSARDQDHIARKNYNQLKSSTAEATADDNWLAKRQADLESRAISEGLNKHELLELRSTDGRASGATHRIFYRLLFVHRNEATGACFPSAKALAQGTGTQERTVRAQIGIASKLGWITIRKRKSSKSGQWVNSYEFPGLAESGSSDRKAGPRLVISNDEKAMQLPTQLESEDMQFPAHLVMEGVQDSTERYAGNDMPGYAGNCTLTSEENHGKKPQNKNPLLSSNAGAGSSREEEEEGNSISGETGQSERSGDHSVQSSNAVPMDARLRKLDRDTKRRWVELCKDAGLDDDQALAMHPEFVAAHLDQVSQDWASTILSWMKSKTAEPIDQPARKAATSGKRAAMPRALRDLEGSWAETYRNVAAEFGMSSDMVEDNHRRFVEAKTDRYSGDWEGEVRQWVENGARMAKDRASRSAASSTSKSGPSSHIPQELTDTSHPNYDAFRAQLEPLARKHIYLCTSAKIDAQRVPFKAFWSRYDNRDLSLLEAWEVFLPEQKRKGLFGPRRMHAV